MHTRQWQELNELRELLCRQIDAAEQEMAGFLAKTPYILLLSVTGINVVSAARLAGEAGPIEHYASAPGPSTDEPVCSPRDTKVMKSITQTVHSCGSAIASCGARRCWWPRT
jgi:hypothetical protein